MPTTVRRHADHEQFWRDTIAAWKEPGQLVRAFCAARGVGQATFYSRRRDLAGRDHPRQPATPTPSPAFAAVRVISDPTVEVIVPGGVILHVPTGADPAAVARLVLALRGESC